MPLTPNDINKLTKAVEHDVKKLVVDYFNARITEDLDPLKIQMTEMYETMIDMAERLTTLEDAVLPDGATHDKREHGPTGDTEEADRDTS